MRCRHNAIQEVDAHLQAEDVRAVLHGDQLTVVVSPDVAATSLAFLSTDFALAVAGAIDRYNRKAAG